MLHAAALNARSQLCRLSQDELAFIFEHCGASAILAARLAIQCLVKPGSSAVTTLYAKQGLIHEQAWERFPNAFYVIATKLAQLPASTAHLRLLQLLRSAPSRVTVIKACSDFAFYTSEVSGYSPSSGGSSSISTGSSKHLLCSHMRQRTSGIQFLECNLPLSTDQVDILLEAGQQLRVIKLQVGALACKTT